MFLKHEVKLIFMVLAFIMSSLLLSLNCFRAARDMCSGWYSFAHAPCHVSWQSARDDVFQSGSSWSSGKQSVDRPCVDTLRIKQELKEWDRSDYFLSLVQCLFSQGVCPTTSMVLSDYVAISGEISFCFLTVSVKSVNVTSLDLYHMLFVIITSGLSRWQRWRRVLTHDAVATLLRLRYFISYKWSGMLSLICHSNISCIVFSWDKNKKYQLLNQPFN